MPERLRGGVPLHYELSGRGKPIVFIHGNSCDLTFFSPQAAYFSATHTVVSLDLRGHGGSGKPDWEYTVHGLAEDVGWLCFELGITRAALVGHSLGGLVAVQAATRHPELAACVGVLDSALLPGAGRPSRLTALQNALRGEEYLVSLRRYFEGAFEPDDDPEIKEHILDLILQTPQHVLVSLFEHASHYDFKTALGALEVPLLYVQAARPRADVSRLRELVPRLVTGQTVGSGHFMTLTVPDQVNAMLARFLAMVGWA